MKKKRFEFQKLEDDLIRNFDYFITHYSVFNVLTNTTNN